MYKELQYDHNISKVKGVQFCILSPQDILQRSVVEITRTETYAGNEPCDNGLFDIRMGTMELGKKCATCEQNNIFCPGHFGHIVLAKPVFYVKFLPVLVEILKCVCFRCSKLLVDTNAPEVQALQARRCSRQKRWEAMSKLCQKAKTCPCCREKQPDKVKENESTMIKMEWRDGDNVTTHEQVFSAEDVLRILKRVSEEDGETLGFSSRFNRPEWMICTVLPVPPPAVRPSVRNDTGQRSEDDLTHILSEIIKFNNFLRGRIEKGATREAVMFNTMMLQYHVATLVDNSAPTMYVTSKDRTGRTLRTLVDRLKSKEGRIRGNLMGKRVDFSARTVITPDPNLSIDELGVPLQIAMNLTFPEVVNGANLEEMRQLVRNGPEVYPGAKHVRKAQQGMRTVRLKGNTTPNIESIVDVGDVVERHLRNGDYVLFNRQPSLHKMSMMAHRVRVMPGKSFRLNVCVCASYNADFDGDEMNMHLPQSHQTHEEIRHLAAVQLHVISPRHGKPIVTPEQDVTLGAFLMTQPTTTVTRSQFMNMTCVNPMFTADALPPPQGATPAERETLSGRQLMSTVLPTNTNVVQSGVLIEDGVLMPTSRAINSKTYKTPSNGLVHSIYSDKGPDIFTTFINNTQKLVCDWLVLSGFSVGVSDLALNDAARAVIRDIMVQMKDAVYQTIQDVHNGRLQNLSTRSNAEFFETQLINLMSKGHSEAQNVAIKAFNPGQNRMLNMIDAGSKGGAINFAQMVSSVGQQIVDDKRVTDGYDNRSLPHFTKFDDGPSSRGFVENSFIDGLTPHEFFFHAMGGRIGLIDTAVKTSETGYIQRKLVKSMEDCKVHHDYTVRNAAGQIVQFLYGDDGADAAKVEYHYLPYLDASMASQEAFRDAYLISHTAELAPYVRPDVVEAMLRETPERAVQEALLQHFVQLQKDRRFVREFVHGRTERPCVVFPVNMERIVMNTAQVMRKYGASDVLADLDPMTVLREIEAMDRELVVGRARTEDVNRIPLFGVLLRAFLSPKRLIMKYRLTRLGFERVAQAVRASFHASLVNPGEVVGITAAQSIGEPTTQLSVVSSAQILIASPDTGRMYKGDIGKYVDDLLKTAPSSAVSEPEDGSVVMNLPDTEQHFVVGVSDDEKTSWRRVSQVSRHPAKGGMVRILTKSGKTTCATLSHSFLKRTVCGVEPVKGHDLKTGDRVPVASHIPPAPEPLCTIDIGNVPYELTRDLGWLFGVYLADGCVIGNRIYVSKVIPEFQDKLRHIVDFLFAKRMHSKDRPGQGVLNGWDMSRYNSTSNEFQHAELAEFLRCHFQTGSSQKRVPAFVYASNADFVRGLLGGYFDGDGNVGTGVAKSTVRSASISEELTEDIILLLAYVGIFACKCRERHLKTPSRRDLITVQVLRKHAPKFRDEIGFVVRSKAAALDALVDYVRREDAHNNKDETDMIPELGETIAFIGKTLQLDGQSRLYGRFTKKSAIGRETLRKYVKTFEEAAFSKIVDAQETHADNDQKISALRDLHVTASPDARNVITLPSDLGHMIFDLGKSVLKSCGLYQWKHLGSICRPTLARIIERTATANDAFLRSVVESVDAVEPHMAVLRQALFADVVWDEIVGLERLPDPGEMVYDLTVPGNDSFMVDCGVLVHNTLNSVHYDEELLLSVDGRLQRTKIGDFTHDVMAALRPSEVEIHDKDAHFAWIRGRDVKVMSVDTHGKVDWQNVEAVTHHPVVNEDGSGSLLYVRTRTGRTVTATRGRSFLKRVDNKIVAINGSDLRVGDRLPVSTVLTARDVAPVDELEVCRYLSPRDWLYMSHVEAALEEQAKGERRWYQTAKERRGVELPYSRSDAVLCAFVGTPTQPPTRKSMCLSGHVYPATISKRDTVAHIPEKLPLDEDFGWLVGAYLAEGCIAVGANKRGAPHRPYALLICNMQPEFKQRFVRFCERYDIGYHVDAGTRLMASGNRSPTVSLRMHSLLLGELFMKMFGNGAAEKRIDPTLFGAPDGFLRALLDGYWSGDGHVLEKGNSMAAYSASRALLIDIQQIMTRFGIMTAMHRESARVHDRNLEKHDSATRGYTLMVPAAGSARFRELVRLCVCSKRQRLDEGSTEMTHAVYDIVPDVILSTGNHARLRRSKVADMLAGTKNDGDHEVLRRIQKEDVFYDEVVSIDDVPNAGHDRVYDLTVANSHTFSLANGVYVCNTFHLSGVGSGASGSLTNGVPRLRELFNVSKNIKTPAMTIAVKKEFATDRDKCADIMNSIQTARFRDVVKASRIYFDPFDSADLTNIAEDRDLLRLYAAYADFLSTACDKRKSPWLVRFEFDRAEMLKRNVYFTDIEFALRDHNADDLSCIFSDDNADKLVCRVRLNISNTMDRNDILTEVMALEQSILDSVVIKGVKDIEKAVLQQPAEFNKVYDEISGTFVNHQEWKIITAGTNLVDVMTNPYVDYVNTVTNDVVEVLRVLGIEAARAALYNELKAVMWMGDKDNNVNHRHMALLVDTITNRGHLVSIDRHGINKGDIGPLAKCSFEETDKMLIKAGIFCELDKINGVSANIMLGQVPPCGTGDGDVIMDVDAIAANVDPAEVDDRYSSSTSSAAAAREKEDAEAIRAAAATGPSHSGFASAVSGRPPLGVRAPERDVNVVAKKEEDIEIL